MDTIGPWELLIIVAVLVALFGASRLPKMARGLGEGIRELKKGLSEASNPPADEASSPTEDSEPSDSVEQDTNGRAEQPSDPADQRHAPTR